MIDQLPLNIQLRDDATLNSFYPGENLEALNAIRQFSQGLGEPFLYLWGQLGVGRTHLLQAACQAAGELGVSAVYIPLQAPLDPSAAILQGVEEIPLVCIDNIHTIAGNRVWEEALFHLFNRIRAQQGHLLVAADVSPIHLQVSLPDLKSRLASGVVYQLHRLSDEEKLSALQLRARCRGLIINSTVGQFLLNRCSRNLSELFLTLEKLDNASLAEQRRLTIPFVKHVLNL